MKLIQKFIQSRLNEINILHFLCTPLSLHFSFLLQVPGAGAGAGAGRCWWTGIISPLSSFCSPGLRLSVAGRLQLGVESEQDTETLNNSDNMVCVQCSAANDS